MRFTYPAAASVIAASVLALAPSAGSQDPSAPPQATPEPAAEAAPPPTYWQRQGCERKITRGQYRKAQRRVFRYSVVDGHFNARQPREAARKRLARKRQCSGSREEHRHRRKMFAKHKRQFRWVLRIDLLTVAGDYVVSDAVIGCEGGRGGWNVYNTSGSGAAGPYQLMAMHGRPMPAEGNPAAQARHHEIAYRISNGGSNYGPWEASRHCWGG
jgi:hypothetical protein